MRRLFTSGRFRWVLVITLAFSVLVLGTCAFLFRTRTFTGDPALDEKTYVAESTIPGAGLGLFAARDILKGEIIAEMGGRLVFEARVPAAKRGYLFAMPPCARWDVFPYDALDGRYGGGRASRINFAPRIINGQKTHFQNARGWFICKRPYVAFEAIQDISRGTEILTSYGPIYNYDFMDFPAVRDHFCGRAHLDCSERFEWEP